MQTKWWSCKGLAACMKDDSVVTEPYASGGREREMEGGMDGGMAIVY